jgi:hypothetical protein
MTIIRMIRLFAMWLALVVCASGADLEVAALQILAGVPAGRRNCFIDSNGDGVRDGTSAGFTLDQIRAITNRADVLALAAQMDGEARQPTDFPFGIAVPDIAKTNVMAGVVVIDGVVDAVDAHASPFEYAAYTNRIAVRRAERQAIRDALRLEIEDAKTNRQDCVALVAAQTNGIARLRAVSFGATYSRSVMTNFQALVIEDAQRQRDAIAELRQTNAEQADVIRLLRRQLLDARPEATPQ